MSTAAAQWAAFAREVAASGRVWAVRDEGGFPAPMTSTGRRAMPFWSTRSRAERVIATVPAYGGFTPHEIAWAEFRDEWLVGAKERGELIGVNWSGPRATGYDIEPDDVRARVEYELGKTEPSE